MTASDDLNLTTTETAALEELSSKLTNEPYLKNYNENHLLYRFLKARDWDVNQAEIMLRKWVQWKKQVADPIVKDHKPSEIVQKYFGNWHIGYDKDDCPLYYIALGKYDSKGLHMAAKYSDIEKMTIQIGHAAEDYLEKTSKKLNRRLPGFVYIFNLEGLTFANATEKKGIETLIRLTKSFQDSYPERLKAAYIINASAFCTLPINILKTFLPSTVLNKIYIYGTTGWQDVLLKAIDASQLPKFLGGTRTDPNGNPLCKTFLNQGGKVDEKYYIHKTKNSLLNSPGVKKLVLARASFSEMELKIKDPGSIIEWDFETKTKDIGFGVFYKNVSDGEEQLTELVPLQRMETDDFFETGMYKCDKAGDYVILFDNSYSWVRSKEIFYRIRIVTPDEHKDQMK